MNAKARFPIMLVSLLAGASAMACGAGTLLPTAAPDTAPPAVTQAVATVTAEDVVPVAAQDTQAPTAVIEPTAAAVANSLQDSLIGVYAHANPSTVYIIVPPGTSGSGFVYSDDGYIVTNNHVVAGGASYEIVFANGERREAELVGADVDSDLAVLRSTRCRRGLGHCRWRNPTAWRWASSWSLSATHSASRARCRLASSAGWAAAWRPSAARLTQAAAIRCRR